MSLKYLHVIFFGILLIIVLTIYLEYSETSNSKSWSFKVLNNAPNRSTIIQQILNLSDQNSKIIKSQRIFCLILTTENNLKTKAKVVHETWASKCDNYTFISMIPGQAPSQERKEIKYNNLFNLLKPKDFLKDTYGNLTSKIYAAFKDVYSHNQNYDWFLKADDDTFIFIDNLRLFLKDKNQSESVTYGYNFKVLVKEGYHSGGGGYLLSQESMSRLANKLIDDLNFCPNSGIEDVDVAKCLRKLDVHPGKSIDEKGRERFHPLGLSDHYNNNFPDWLMSYAENLPKAVNRFFII